MMRLIRGFAFVCLMAGLWCLTGLPLNAQSSSTSSNTSPSAVGHSALTPAYDLSKEITVHGTVQQIETGNTDPAGLHVILQATQGDIDAHLAISRAVNASSLGLSVGQHIEITGMMATIDGNSVLLARILTTPTRIFVLRSPHGIPVRVIPRGNSAAGSRTFQGGL
jgi:cell division ATPase FtsA